jgi:hypothetical protein
LLPIQLSCSSLHSLSNTNALYRRAVSCKAELTQQIAHQYNFFIKNMIYLFSLGFLIRAIIFPFFQVRPVDRPKVSAIFTCSDNSINLTLTNTSNTPLYLLTNIEQNIKIFYEGKKIKDINILYNPDDFTPLPEPPKYDSTLLKNRRMGTYINRETIKKADSILQEFMLNEYKKLNKILDISPEDKQIIMTYMRLSMGTEMLLFLDPHESYTFKNHYSCFKRMTGNYQVKAKSQKKKYIIKTFKIRNEKENKVYKIPLTRPPELLGYKRYDGPINPESYSFLIKKKP